MSQLYVCADSTFSLLSHSLDSQELSAATKRVKNTSNIVDYGRYHKSSIVPFNHFLMQTFCDKNVAMLACRYCICSFSS